MCVTYGGQDNLNTKTSILPFITTILLEFNLKNMLKCVPLPPYIVDFTKIHPVLCINNLQFEFFSFFKIIIFKCKLLEILKFL